MPGSTRRSEGGMVGPLKINRSIEGVAWEDALSAVRRPFTTVGLPVGAEGGNGPRETKTDQTREKKNDLTKIVTVRATSFELWPRATGDSADH